MARVSLTMRSIDEMIAQWRTPCTVVDRDSDDFTSQCVQSSVRLLGRRALPGG